MIDQKAAQQDAFSLWRLFRPPTAGSAAPGLLAKRNDSQIFSWNHLRRVFLILPILVDAACAQTPAPKAYIGLFGDNAVAVFDTKANQVLSTIPVPKGPHGVVVTPDGRKVYVSSEGDTKVSIISTATDQVTGAIEVGPSPQGLTLSADGKLLLLSSNGTGHLTFIDPGIDAVIGQVAIALPHTSAISADGLTAYVGSQASPPLLVTVDLTRRVQKNTATLTNTPRALSLSLTGMVVFSATGLDSVQVFDPAANLVSAQIATGGSPHAILPLAGRPRAYAQVHLARLVDGRQCAFRARKGRSARPRDRASVGGA